MKHIRRIVTIRWVPPDEDGFSEMDFRLPEEQMKLEVFQTKLVLDGCFVERRTKANFAEDHGDDERHAAHGG